MIARKRPLARRSCLKCREKKARCELPDVYVDSSKTPLAADKQCHRCNVLGIECIVWDGDRKRKPKLDRRDHLTPRTSVERDSTTPANSAAAEPSSSNSPSGGAFQNGQSPSKHQTTSSWANDSERISNPAGPSRNAESEQLAASDVSHAQRLLLHRQNAWRTMASTLHSLIERLQRERKYSKYLKLRIDAPPSTPDIVAFLQPDKVLQLDLQLQDYLVGHPYLPSLLVLHRQQVHNPTRPRALLLATMTLLGLRGIEDELSSADTRNLSNYIDRLGTQMLLSSPRDIQLVMAFELLLAHEPGLVGTAASQFEPEGRGFGLASENLLTCAIKIAGELRLGRDTAGSQDPTTRLSHHSLWCCLRVWESLYAFLGEHFTFVDDLNARFSSDIRANMEGVDDNGLKLPTPPRLPDASGPTTGPYHEMRKFCVEMEERHGRDGILRSAGRTIICQRIEMACCLFTSLRDLRDTVSDAGLSQEEQYRKISDIHKSGTDAILMVRELSDEQLGKSQSHSDQTSPYTKLTRVSDAFGLGASGFYAGQRLVRLWEQFVHIEGAFFCSLLGSHSSSALFTGKLDSTIDSNDLIRSVRFRLGPALHIADVGRFSMEMSRVLLSCVSQLDRQPTPKKRDVPNQDSPRYLYRLPTLLVCAMTVQATRRCLESIAFVLVAWARISTDASMLITMMEAAIPRVDMLSPKSSVEGADTIAQVSADYIEEMVETARLWQVYYRVYRPVSSVRLDQPSAAGQSEGSTSAPSQQSAENRARTSSADSSGTFERSAMDFLASAAEAAQGSAPLGVAHKAADFPADSRAIPSLSQDPGVTNSASASASAREVPYWDAQGLDTHPAILGGPNGSNLGPVGAMDTSLYDACIPFDLEAFLKDVDQLF